MEVSFSEQINVALMSVVLGLAFGAIYDDVRIFRTLLGVSYVNKFSDRLKKVKLPFIKNPYNFQKSKRKIAENVMVFVTDMAYFLVITAVMIVYTYHVNSGIVRWYIFGGAIVGILLYYVTLGRLIISVSECIAFFIRAFFLYIAFFLSKPFLILCLKTKPYFKKIKSTKNKDKKSNQKTSNRRVELYKLGK
jgi:hypothetical protein